MISKRDKLGRILRGSGRVHGLSKDSMYDCWVAMKARCNNPSHPQYRHYGARGIQVCERWKSSFTNFLKDVGMKPTPKHTLDRIDVNGNYKPGNCRWITIQEQQKNRRNNNKVPGVHFEKARKKWHVDITFMGKKHFLGRFKDLLSAKLVREKAERELWHTFKPLRLKRF